MFKNLFSPEKRKTTIQSIVTILLFMLSAFGLITSDQKEAINDAYRTIVDAIPGGDWTVVISAAAILINQIVLIVVKDPKPNTPPKLKK